MSDAETPTVVRSTDDETDELDGGVRTYGSLGLDEELLRNGTPAQVKEHLQRLQHGDIPTDTNVDGGNSALQDIIELGDSQFASEGADEGEEEEEDDARIDNSAHRRLITKRRKAQAIKAGRNALNMCDDSGPMTPRGLLKGLDDLAETNPFHGDFVEEEMVSKRDAENEKTYRQQQRRSTRVLHILNRAVEDGHVRHPDLVPGGVPIEFHEASTTKCMTSYKIRWQLPEEIESGLFDDAGTQFKHFESSHIRGNPTVLRARASKALEKVAGRLRTYMLKHARLRKAPRLHFEYHPSLTTSMESDAVGVDLGVTDDEDKASIQDLLRAIEQEIGDYEEREEDVR